jgi:hypothetical protein
MFKLYYYFYNSTPELMFTDFDLEPCLNYIKSSNLNPLQCLIITPNNRRITFDYNCKMAFSEFISA